MLSNIDTEGISNIEIKEGQEFIASKWISLKEDLAAVYKIRIEDKEIKIIMAYRNGSYDIDDNFKLLEDIFIEEEE